MVCDSSVKILPLEERDYDTFCADMEDAFRAWFLEEGGVQFNRANRLTPMDEELRRPDCDAYKAVVDGGIVGGAIVIRGEDGKSNELSYLYVKRGSQHGGIGGEIIRQLEELYPETELWWLVTPYFARKNINFYINVCGYRATEFFNPYHKGGNQADGVVGRDYYFKFEKRMK